MISMTTILKRPYLVAIIAGMLIAVTALTTSSTNFAEAKGNNNEVVMLTCVIFSTATADNAYVFEVTASGGVDISGIIESEFVGTPASQPFDVLTNCAQTLADLLNSGFVIDNVVAQPRAPAFDGDSSAFNAFGMHNVYTLLRQGQN